MLVFANAAYAQATEASGVDDAMARNLELLDSSDRTEMERGLDVFELVPSAAISQNEIDAAKSVKFDFLNVQDQPKFVWPASFALSRS